MLRKKAGRSINILDYNYYAWSFEMTMQKIQKTVLEVDFRMVKYTNSNFTDLKLGKRFLFHHPLVEFNASFVWFGLQGRGDVYNNIADIILFGILFSKLLQPT